MKNFPKSFYLNVFGAKIPVKVVKNFMHTTGNHGLYYPISKEVCIAEDQTKEEAIHTLIHELVHAVFARAGLNQAVEDKIEEIVAEQVGTVITENFNLSLKRR